MNLLRHPIAALVIFAVLIGLFTTLYNSMESNYAVVPETDSLVNGTNIGDSINGLLILDGMQNITAVGLKMNPPSGQSADILGAIQAAGIGSIKVVAGVFTFPVEIINIIGNYYELPKVVTYGAITVIMLYLTFIVISLFIGRDV